MIGCQPAKRMILATMNLPEFSKPPVFHCYSLILSGGISVVSNSEKQHEYMSEKVLRKHMISSMFLFLIFTPKNRAWKNTFPMFLLQKHMFFHHQTIQLDPENHSETDDWMIQRRSWRSWKARRCFQPHGANIDFLERFVGRIFGEWKVDLQICMTLTCMTLTWTWLFYSFEWYWELRATLEECAVLKFFVIRSEVTSTSPVEMDKSGSIHRSMARVKGPQIWSPLQHVCTIPICHFWTSRNLKPLPYGWFVQKSKQPPPPCIPNLENNGIYTTYQSQLLNAGISSINRTPLRKTVWVSRISQASTAWEERTCRRIPTTSGGTQVDKNALKIPQSKMRSDHKSLQNPWMFQTHQLVICFFFCWRLMHFFGWVLHFIRHGIASSYSQFSWFDVRTDMVMSSHRPWIP